jgi:SAM-dependent methyltransferase
MNFRRIKDTLPKSLHRPLGAVKRQLMPSYTYCQKAKLLSAKNLDPAKLALLSKTESRISPDDEMYNGDGDHYFKVGLSAIDCLDEALQRARSTTVKEILDLPCGYGRVLRFLVHRFPQARITACELMPNAIRFCAETFGAAPAQSSYDLEELSFATKFDLIWCGSLITHLDADRTRSLLRFFARQLTPEGLLVFSTHGDFVADRIHDMADVYMLDLSSTPQLVRSFHEQGYGYLDYPRQPGYGVSLTARNWIIAEAREVGLTEVYFRAQGWDDHQDVFGFVGPSSA